MRSRLGIAVLAMGCGLALLTGCGTRAATAASVTAAGDGRAAASQAAEPSGATGKPAGLAGVGGKPAGLVGAGARRAALALAWRLVDGLHLPPGTKPSHLTKLPPSLSSTPPRPGWVRASRLLEAPAKPLSGWTALFRHEPFDQPGPYPQLAQSAAETIPATGPGVDAVILSVSIQPLNGTTMLIVAQADAAWLPARTAAEHIDPGSVRAVTVSSTGTAARGHTVTRTVTDRAFIARLAAYLNARTPAPEIIMSCLAPGIGFTADLITSDGQTSMHIATSNCPASDVITVQGKLQPPLWDTGNVLETMIRQVLHVNSLH